MRNASLRFWVISIFAATLFAASGANAVGVGKTCDGLPGMKCDAGLFCNHRANTCGVVDSAGKCVKIPGVCPKIFRPVCGCDNKTYGNDCERIKAGAQLAHAGACKKM